MEKKKDSEKKEVKFHRYFFLAMDNFLMASDSVRAYMPDSLGSAYASLRAAILDFISATNKVVNDGKTSN